MRRKILAANWKMNKLQSDVESFFAALLPRIAGSKNEIVICTPYTCLQKAAECAKNTNVEVGAQNVHWEESGAFTGEISAQMLAELGVKNVIVGHSERRQYFGETNQTVAKRAKAAIKTKIAPIVCIGETLEQRNGGQTEKVLFEQITESFEGITREELGSVVVAYEPVWAIGTGVTATAAEAQQTIAFIRKTFSSIYGESAAQNLHILYGGSMNEKNAAELLSMPDIDGGLIGGASLIAEKFAAIVNAK